MNRSDALAAIESLESEGFAFHCGGIYGESQNLANFGQFCLRYLDANHTLERPYDIVRFHAPKGRDLSATLGSTNTYTFSGNGDTPAVSMMLMIKIAKTTVSVSLRNRSLVQTPHLTSRCDCSKNPTFQCRPLWIAFPCSQNSISTSSGSTIPKRCEQGTGNTREAQAVARKMTAWSNFAKTGNPSQPGLTWEPADPIRCQTMIFDDECRMVDDPDGEERKLLLG